MGIILAEHPVALVIHSPQLWPKDCCHFWYFRLPIGCSGDTGTLLVRCMIYDLQLALVVAIFVLFMHPHVCICSMFRYESLLDVWCVESSALILIMIAEPEHLKHTERKKVTWTTVFLYTMKNVGREVDSIQWLIPFNSTLCINRVLSSLSWWLYSSGRADSVDFDNIGRWSVASI